MASVSGKVVNKSVNVEGTSSVTITGQATVGDASKPVNVTVTLTSQSAELIDGYKPGQSVSFSV